MKYLILLGSILSFVWAALQTLLAFKFTKTLRQKYPFLKMIDRKKHYLLIATIIILAAYAGISALIWIKQNERKSEQKIQESLEREKIIEKLSEVIKIYDDKNASTEMKKAALDSLALWKTPAIPYIVDFAVKNLFSDEILNKDYKDDPNLLFNLETALSRKPLITGLFYVVNTIYRNNADSIRYGYVRDLFLKDYAAGRNQNHVLVTAYYLPFFDEELVTALSNKILIETPLCEWDPIKKALLRAFLSFEKQKFTLKKCGEYPIEKGKIGLDQIEKAELTALGIPEIENGSQLINHLTFSGSYRDLYEMEGSGSRNSGSLSYSDLQKRLKYANEVYLFGFDFSHISVHNLTLNNILLGRSFFEQSKITRLKSSRTNFLVNNFKGSAIEKSIFEQSNMLNCDLEGSFLGLCNIFWGATFSKCKLVNTEFNGSAIIDTNFDHSKLDKTKFGACIMLNCKFDTSSVNGAVFKKTIIDAQTVENLYKLKDFNRSSYEIKNIVRKDDMFFLQFLIDFFESPCDMENQALIERLKGVPLFSIKSI
jgi:uncharacterized protein YjbI with pentapeptide repeats